MESKTIIDRLSALAQEARLSVFRLLVRAGPEGLAAGEIARRLDVPANTLSSQLNLLASAGLIRRARQGRSIIYAADYPAMRELLDYMQHECCRGFPDEEEVSR